MKFDLPTLLGMAAQTLRNPRETAEMILSLGVPRAALLPALSLVIILTILFAQVNELLVPALPDVQFVVSPIVLGFLQLASLLITVAAIYAIGRACGGTGRVDEVLLLMIWLQFILLCLQVIQTVLLLVSTQMASLVAIVSVVLFLFLLTHFVAVVHGFQSLGKVFFMILASAIGLALGLSIILAFLGVSIPVVV
jgi:hypothetical protein